jgi:hemolysin activation/secretion protein
LPGFAVMLGVKGSMRIFKVRKQALVALACSVCVLQAQAQPQSNPVSADSGASVTFGLVDIDLQGVTLLTADEWRSAAQPYLGKTISFADLESARAAIEARFHVDGWRLVSVRIPAQSTADGIVRMEVVEPKLGRVTLKPTGQSTTRNPANWRAALPALVDGSTPNLNKLDRQLAIANENGSRRSQVAFTLDSAEPGKARNLNAEIQGEEQSASRWQAFLDNNGNSQTGYLRYGLAFRNDDMWGLDHQFNVQLTSAPHNEDDPQKLSLLPSSKVQILGLGYRLPLPEQAAFVDASLTYSNVDSGTVAKVFEVAGQGTAAGLKYTRLLDRIGSWEPRVFVGMDWRQYKSQLLFGGVNLAVPITLQPLQFGMSATRVATPQNPLVATAYASLHVNLPGGANGSQPSFTATRQDATANYKLIRLGASVNRPLGLWLVSAAFDAQVASDLLVSSEQLAAGGVSTVRGFSERGIGGDSGLRMQLEALSPNWLTERDGQRASLRGVIFIDAASTRRNRPAVLEQANTSIASAGAGLRAAWGPTVWRLDIAKAIHQNTQAAPRWGAVHFSAAVSF